METASRIDIVFATSVIVGGAVTGVVLRLFGA